MTTVGLVLAMAASPAAPKSLQARCQVVQAILGVRHSGAKKALRDLDCVRDALRGGRLPVRAIFVEPHSTRPFLAAGEVCRVGGYVGVDLRQLSRSSEPTKFVELRLTPRGPNRMSFSVLLEVWGPSGGTSEGTKCGASGEGAIVSARRAWKVSE